jgi:ADP-ribosylarginine hydrolase
MAYDALAYAQNRWEPLVVYSMLHAGDSDSVGCIAASWFGACYGFHNIPSSNYVNNEYKNELIDIAKKIFTKKNNIL